MAGKASKLDALIKKVNDNYGGNLVVPAREAAPLEGRLRIPTGIPVLDIVLGGGSPMGSITRAVGFPSSGKSLIAYRWAGAHQRWCRNCKKPLADWDELWAEPTPRVCCKQPKPLQGAWVDLENSYDPKWAERMTVNNDHLHVVKAPDAEAVVDIADEILRTGEIDFVVVDSIAQMVPKVELDNSAENVRPGSQARLVNSAMRKWQSAQIAGGLAGPFEPSLFMVNQIRFKIGGYGNPQTEPGGEGQKYAADITLQVKRGKHIEQLGGLVLGHGLEVKAVKNKTAPPMRSGEFNLMFATSAQMRRGSGGSNAAEQVLELAKFWGVVHTSGAWYHLAKGVKIQGKEAAADELRKEENRKLYDMLLREVMKREVAWRDGTFYEELEAAGAHGLTEKGGKGAAGE